MSSKPRVFLRYTAPSRGVREKTRGKRLIKPRNLAWEHNSIYYFYFAFLKRNKDFEKIHKNGGKTTMSNMVMVRREHNRAMCTMDLEDYRKVLDNAV